MKFHYLGEEEDMVVFGYDFTNGNTPDVTEETFIRKLSGNSHFAAVVEPVARPAKTEKKEAAPVVIADPDSKDEWPV